MVELGPAWATRTVRPGPDHCPPRESRAAAICKAPGAGREFLLRRPANFGHSPPPYGPADGLSDRSAIGISPGRSRRDSSALLELPAIRLGRRARTSPAWATRTCGAGPDRSNQTERSGPKGPWVETDLASPTKPRGRRSGAARRSRAPGTSRPIRRPLRKDSLLRGEPMPSGRTRREARRGSAGPAKATSRASPSIAHSSSIVSPIRSSARSYSSVSVRSETVVSSVDSVTGTPNRWSRASGCAAIDGTMPACQFEVGQRSRATPRAISSAQSSGSSIAPGPWAIRSGSSSSARRTCGRAAPLAGVERDPQAAGPRGRERRGVERRVRERLLRPGEVPAGQARRRWNRAAVSASSTFAAGLVRADRGADQADLGAGPGGRVPRPARHRRDAVRQGEPARDVEQRPPPDLDVADVLGGLRLDELGGDPLERLGVLHQRDRQVERAEQLGLVAAGHRARRARRASRRRPAAPRRPVSAPAPAPSRSGASRRGGGGARPWASRSDGRRRIGRADRACGHEPMLRCPADDRVSSSASRSPSSGC